MIKLFMFWCCGCWYSSHKYSRYFFAHEIYHIYYFVASMQFSWKKTQKLRHKWANEFEWAVGAVVQNESPRRSYFITNWIIWNLAHQGQGKTYVQFLKMHNWDLRSARIESCFIGTLDVLQHFEQRYQFLCSMLAIAQLWLWYQTFKYIEIKILLQYSCDQLSFDFNFR